MQKKIILFCSGLLVAVLGFIAYQYLTGAALNVSKPVTAPPILDVNMGPGAAHPYFENRDDNGVLQSVLTAERCLPKGGGMYQLIKPKATNYTADGRVLAIVGDEGLVQIDQTGPKTDPKFTPKGGTLSGHVLVTIGPKETFIPNSTVLQPGQIQAQLEQALNFQYAERLLTSEGKVHLRGDRISFDGADLKVLMNADQRRIELLRVEQGQTLTIKDVGSQTFALPGTTAGANDNPPIPAPGGTPPAAPVATPPAPVAPAAVAAAPAAAPPGADLKRTTYKLNFGTNVKAAVGERWLTSQRLQVIFQAGAGEAAKTVGAPAPAAKAPPLEAAPAPVAIAPGPVPTAVSTPAPSTPSTPAPTQDLVITWTGPMEMRPAVPEDGVLAGPKDAIVEAVGTATTPVVIHDAGLRGAQAHRMLLLLANGLEKLQLDAIPGQPVDMFDTASGMAQCQGLTWERTSGNVRFAGPGRAEGSVPAAHPEPGAPPAAPKAPIVATWNKLLDLQLQTVADAKNPGKTTQIVRHAILTGEADVQDATARVHSEVLDVLLARGAQGKTGQALEHVLATGHVNARSAKAPGVAARDDDPAADYLRCAQLEIQTAVFPGTAAPQPSMLLATGDVQAVAHQTDKNDPKKVMWQQLNAPRLVATLEPKAAGAPREELGGFGVQQLQAFEGVKVQIEGLGQQMVVASAQTLTALPRAGTARLEGGDPTLGRAAWAMVRQGSNSLAGPTIMLEQKNQAARIPGAGEFVFFQPGNKANEEPSPVKVAWATSMDYDGKALAAHFNGSVEALLVGKPEQESKLNCDNLDVQMASTDVHAPAGVGVSPLADDAAHRTHLAQVTARGKVTAYGATLDKDGKLLERLYLRVPLLVYDETHKALHVPAAGDLLLEDYRPETATRAAATQETLASGNARGQTAFHWGQSLTYAGDTGTIHMQKDVFMRHVPETPSTPSAPVKPNAMPDPRTTEVQLQCQELRTQLLQAKGAVANPLALGTGGQTKVGKVTADTAAIMTLGNAQIAADVLEYDGVRNQASAYGRNGNVATTIRPEGTAAADRIEWDLTKGSGGITLIGPRGQLQTP